MDDRAGRLSRAGPRKSPDAKGTGASSFAAEMQRSVPHTRRTKPSAESMAGLVAQAGTVPPFRGHRDVRRSLTPPQGNAGSPSLAFRCSTIRTLSGAPCSLPDTDPWRPAAERLSWRIASEPAKERTRHPHEPKSAVFCCRRAGSELHFPAALSVFRRSASACRARLHTSACEGCSRCCSAFHAWGSQTSK